jgi:hypothetical protein
VDESTQLDGASDTNPFGEPIRLEIEGNGASGFRVVGVTADSFKVGEHVTAVVSPSKRHPDRSAHGIEIIKADGTIVPLDRRRAGREPARTTAAAPSIFGTWSPPAEAFTDMLRSRASWAFTEKGRERFESYSPTMSSQAHCIPLGAPWLMVQPVVQQIELASRLLT